MNPRSIIIVYVQQMAGCPHVSTSFQELEDEFCNKRHKTSELICRIFQYVFKLTEKLGYSKVLCWRDGLLFKLCYQLIERVQKAGKQTLSQQYLYELTHSVEHHLGKWMLSYMFSVAKLLRSFSDRLRTDLLPHLKKCKHIFSVYKRKPLQL